MINFKVTNAPPINFDAGARQGPAGPDGNATSIPANTAIGNFTNAAALPTARTREEWIAWLQVATDAELAAALATKQDTLVSGTSIRTVNGNNLLGSGDVAIAAGIGGSTGGNDNRLLRSDGTGGAAVQPSGVTLDDSDNATGFGSILAIGPVELRNGVNPTSIVVNNTWTNTSNYERGFVRFASNVFEVGTEQLGTGTARNFNVVVGGARRLQVDTSARLRFGSNANGAFLIPTSNGADDPAGIDLVFSLTGGATARSFVFGVVGTPVTATGGLYILNRMQQTFSPTSGSASYEMVRMSPTINQTGGASGITRGFCIDATLTNAADFRAFDCLHNTGFAYHSSGTAPSRFGGDVIAQRLIGLGVYTVATLPSASANPGRIAQVTDSSVTANGSPVAGGGANRVMVFSTGTTWDVVVA